MAEDAGMDGILWMERRRIMTLCDVSHGPKLVQGERSLILYISG